MAKAKAAEEVRAGATDASVDEAAAKMSAKDVVQALSHASYEELEGLICLHAYDTRKQVQKALASALKRLEKMDEERARVNRMYEYQAALAPQGVVVGIDEVGRGSIAGPLTVCAVVLPDTPRIWGLNDSKQLTPKAREELAAEVRETAVAVGIAHIPPESIDALGMGNSLRHAMRKAIEDTGLEPDTVLIDGNPIGAHPLEKCVVKGDARVACISAASIVAKVTRDALMVEYAAQYPQYHLDSCKGYASAAHIAAIREYGLSPIHRVSFCENFV